MPEPEPDEAALSYERSPESRRLKLVPAATSEHDEDAEEEDGEQEQLLAGEHGDGDGDSESEPEQPAGAGTVRAEQWQIFRLAWPVATTFIMQSSTQQMTIIFVGQLGALQLGAASMANMWINITGMSIIYGGMSAYDTLGSQAYGAKNYRLVGLLAQRCLAICTLLCVPISLCWWHLTGPVLVLVGIEQRTADLAADFARANILCLWPTLAHNVLQRFLRSQGVVRPVTFVMVRKRLLGGAILCAVQRKTDYLPRQARDKYRKSLGKGAFLQAVCSCLFAPVAWWFVDRFGFVGAPLANAVLNWFLLLFLLSMVKWRGYHAQCWDGWSSEAWSGWRIILKLGTAGVMGTFNLSFTCGTTTILNFLVSRNISRFKRIRVFVKTGSKQTHGRN
jgi:Na+-driven multidrug efflux pump